MSGETSCWRTSSILEELGIGSRSSVGDAAPCNLTTERPGRLESRSLVEDPVLGNSDWLREGRLRSPRSALRLPV